MRRHSVLLLLLAGCAASPQAPIKPPPPASSPQERAAVPGVDVPALLARDKLLQEADPDACCGQGKLTLRRAHWAELDGHPPAELVLEMDVFAGPGGLNTSIHAYDVRDPAHPKALGKPIFREGYHLPHFLRVVDVDADGVDELMLVGSTNEVDKATLERFGLSNALLVPHGAPLREGLTYLFFDHDGDGTQEIIALSYEKPVLIQDPTWKLFDRHGAELPLPKGAPPAWLPAFLATALAAPDLRRADLTRQLLEDIRRRHALAP